MIVALDGPSGAGKSSAARLAAQALGYVYIDTGALYRAIGLAVRMAGGSTEDAAQVAGCLPGLALSIQYLEGEQHVFLGGKNVSNEIRTPESSLAASNVAKIPAVRAFLLELQRELARKQNSILDGRDIGTVVLPEANLKIFLTASPEARAARRWSELQGKGLKEPYEKVLAEILFRDNEDANRPIAPLKPARDSILLDTTGMALEQVVETIVELVRRKCA
jgi:cytidylate kinase